MSGQLHPPAALPCKITPYPSNGRLVGPHSRSGHFGRRESLALVGIRKQHVYCASIFLNFGFYGKQQCTIGAGQIVNVSASGWLFFPKVRSKFLSTDYMVPSTPQLFNKLAIRASCVGCVKPAASQRTLKG